MQYQQDLLSALHDIHMKLADIGLGNEALPEIKRCREIVTRKRNGSAQQVEAILDRLAMQFSQHAQMTKLWPAFARFDALLKKSSLVRHQGRLH